MRAHWLLATLAWSGVVVGQPYRPADDRRVLLTLPPEPPPVHRSPEDVARQGASLIEAARRSGDPRPLGYAEGLLRPWQDDRAPPSAVRLLRATLRQARHDFVGALQELDTLLRDEPLHPQALLTRATVLRVQGRLAEAADACDRLRASGADPLVAAVCVETVRGLRGELPAALAALDRLAPRTLGRGAGERAWFAAERGAMAERLGQNDRALSLYLGALAAAAEDPLLRAAAADLLLDAGRPADALRIIGEAPGADVLRLRVALARRALKQPDARLEATLVDSYGAARRRGEPQHLHEEARFVLAITGDAARALELALHNWRDQREPADARLLAEAALAAGRPDAAQAVRDFVGRHGLEDARLEALLRRSTR